MTPPILENISTWLVDWCLVIMGNTPPPRDPNDENDENDEDDEDDKDDKDDEDDIEDDENDDERHDGATGRPGGHGFLRSRPATSASSLARKSRSGPRWSSSPAPRWTDPQLNMREA
jgi:hypothetical protein